MILLKKLNNKKKKKNTQLRFNELYCDIFSLRLFSKDCQTNTQKLFNINDPVYIITQLHSIQFN